MITEYRSETAAKVAKAAAKADKAAKAYQAAKAKAKAAAKAYKVAKAAAKAAVMSPEKRAILDARIYELNQISHPTILPLIGILRAIQEADAAAAKAANL